MTTYLEDSSAEQPVSERAAYSDVLTLAAIGAIVYVVSSFIHEGIGHGGMCLLVGGKPLSVSSTFFNYDSGNSHLSPWEMRWINAGGTLANLLAGLVCLALLRLMRRASPSLRYVLWLAMSVNLFQAGGYLMASPIGNFGDWQAFMTGLEPQIAWRIGLIALGLLISFWALRVSSAELAPFLNRDKNEYNRRAAVLTLIPYLAGSTVMCVAALFGPGGMQLVVISAMASSFGGTCWLVWAPWAPSWARDPGVVYPERPLIVGRNLVLIVAGLLAAIVCIAILGPSVPLNRCYAQ